MSLPYDASYPAVSAAKERETFLAGQALVSLIEKNIRPRDIITRKSLENAYTLRAGPGRLDQRRAAPDGDRPRGRGRRGRWPTSTASATRCRTWPT